MRLRRLDYQLALLTVLAGLMLAVLFALGSFGRIDSAAFFSVGAVHLVLQCCAVCLSLVLFVRLTASAAWPKWIAPACFLLFAAVILLAAIPPVTDQQALSTYLFLPQQWLAAGKLSEIEWHEPSYYPALIELGFIIPLRLGAEQLCSLYHFSFLLLMAGIAAALVLEKTAEPESALFAFILALSLPLCQRVAATPLVHLGIAVYVIAALFFLNRWSEDGGGWSVLCAALAMGLAAHSSTSGFLAMMLILALIIVLGAQAQKSALSIAWALIGSAFIIVTITAPLMVRNMLWTTNPFYPLFSSIIGSSNITFKFDPYQLPPLPVRLAGLAMDWRDLISLPIQMIAFGSDNDARSFHGMLSPILLLAVFPIFRRSRPAWLSFAYFFAVFYFIFAAFLKSLNVIELAPLGGVAVVLSALGFRRVGEIAGPALRGRLYAVLLGIHLIFAMSYGANLLRRRAALPHLASGESDEAYLERHMPDHALIQYVNSGLPPDAITLLEMAPTSFFYYRRSVISEGSGQAQRMAQWISQQHKRHLLSASLRAMGISHLATDNDRLHQALKSLLTPRDFDLWLQFLAQDLDLLETRGKYSVYRIASKQPEKKKP